MTSNNFSIGFTNSQRTWRARMCINARSIPQLMRGGFHWPPTDNILPELTVITMDDRTLDDELRNAGFRHTKSFVMTENKDGQQWTGKIIVYARRPGTLSEAEFQLGLLTPKTIWKCKARNWDGQRVYWYDRDESLSPINTIYSNMRLSGCWPQPPETDAVSKCQSAVYLFRLPPHLGRACRVNSGH